MLSPILFLALLVPAVDGPPAPVVELHRPKEAVAPAVADARAFLPREQRCFLRYVSLMNERPTDVANVTLIVKSVVNRLSQKPVFYHPVPIAGGRVLRVNLYELGIDPKAWDKLVSVGSGRVPLPEPYHYQVIEQTFVETVTKTWGGGIYPVDGQYYPAGRQYEVDVKHTKRTLALASWLSERKPDGTFDASKVAELAALTETVYPLIRGDWLAYYALLEPRYHELLGLGETLDELFEHLGVDRKKTDRAGAESKGVVLNSEVAIHNRALNRYPILNKRGKGVLWISDDFNTSINDDDLLSDARNLINAKPAAHEVLWTLPNGLMGGQVFNGDGKRLDRADTNVAKDTRNHFLTVDVEVRNCMVCHAAGYIAISDEVRETARDKISAQVEQIRKTDPRLAKQVADRFFVTDIATETEDDSALHDAWNKALTGRAAAADGLTLYKLLIRYEKPRAIADMAFETGYPEIVIRGALERAQKANLDHSVIALLRIKPRPGVARIDQLERRGFADIMGILNVVPEKKDK